MVCQKWTWQDGENNCLSIFCNFWFHVTIQFIFYRNLLFSFCNLLEMALKIELELTQKYL
jgi:hypothetical protein